MLITLIAGLLGLLFGFIFGGAADKEDSRAGSVSDSIYLLYPGDSAAGAALFILLRDTDAAASH